MITVKLIGAKELEKKMKRIEKDIIDKMEAAVMTGALIIQNDAKKRAPYKTGTLRKSIHMETAKKTKESIVIEVGTDLEYAAIHEFGGTITPKNSKFLAIPIGNLKGSPRKHKLRVAQTLKGQYILVDDSGKAQYLLRRSVTISPRPYLRPALDENEHEIKKRIRDELRRVFEKVM